MDIGLRMAVIPMRAYQLHCRLSEQQVESTVDLDSIKVFLLLLSVIFFFKGQVLGIEPRTSCLLAKHSYH